MRIGVDVGGTNTDAVLMDGTRVVAKCKTPTTSDIRTGIVAAVRTVLAASATSVSAIRCVMIGTTQFTNAFVERKELLKTGVIRIGLPAAQGIPPLVDWPQDLLAEIGNHGHQVRGGYQFDGRVNVPLDEQAVAGAARHLSKQGIRTVAISSVFSPINGAMERRGAEIVRNEMGDVSLTLSHEIGRMGLLERENAAIMNASLAALSKRVVDSFRSALASLGIDAPFFISQNDGTLMAADYIERYPVLTFASGPTNSMRGAAYLSGLHHALVADVGGTTTDIGMLLNGFARESAHAVTIGGVRTNFRMPDILALGLGGGSEVRREEGCLAIGPRSVGYELTTRAMLFGGTTLTASDIAVAAGYADIGDRSRVAALPTDLVDQAVAEIHSRISDGVDRMKTSAEPLPLVLVGGGSVLVGGDIGGVSEVIVPPDAEVANAIGASIALVSGETDRVFSYAQIGREGALEQAKREAIDNAIEAGAKADGVEIVEVEEVPLAYAPDDVHRLRAKATGPIGLHDPSAGPRIDHEVGR